MVVCITGKVLRPEKKKNTAFPHFSELQTYMPGALCYTLHAEQVQFMLF